MMRCTFCGTGLAHDATRCWLCHAGVQPGAASDGPADLDFLPHPAHVWTGQLAQAAVPRRDGRPVARRSPSLWRRGLSGLRAEVKMLMTLLILLASVLPYAATGNRNALLLFGVPFGVVGLWSIKHIWRRTGLG